MQHVTTHASGRKNNQAKGRLDIHDPEGSVDTELLEWLKERLGHMQTRYGMRLTHIEVRFGEMNKPQGVADRSCVVSLEPHGLDPIAIEMRADSDRVAFDLAADRAQWELEDALSKLGFHVKSKGRSRGNHDGFGANDKHDPARRSLFDKRVGRNDDQLKMLQARPEKDRRDVWIDTAEPGVSADQRKAGNGHSAKRNTRLHTSGAAYHLEDSGNGQPSRRSTRAGLHGIKPAGGLAIRTQAAVHKPSARAARAH
jgi:hypothetical protein